METSLIINTDIHSEERSPLRESVDSSLKAYSGLLDSIVRLLCHKVLFLEDSLEKAVHRA